MTASRPFSSSRTHITARRLTAALLVAAAGSTLAACGSDPSTIAGSVSGGTDTTTASSAPDASEPGGTVSTLAGPVTVQTIGTTGAPTGDAARGAVVASVVGGALGAGITLDPACVAGVVAQLSDGDLAVLAANLDNHSTPPPTLSPAGEALADELEACAPAVANTIAAAGSTAEDVCAQVDAAALDPLNDALGTGTAIQIVGPYGAASACEFEGNGGLRVTVAVTRGADLDGWEEEITDGDGLGDGTLRRGIGQLAAVGVGFADATNGADLIEVSVFPSFDVAEEVLLQVLTDVVDSIAF